MSMTLTHPRNYGSVDACYFRDVSETSLLTAEAERDLGWRIQDGDAEAREQMVRANMRLVVYLARKYVGRGLSLQDLIQEGNLGLMHAVEGYEPGMQTRFSTYARYWITQSIQRALESFGVTIRVPNYATDLVRKWRKTTVCLRNELDRQPTEEEVAGKMGLSAKRLRIVKKALRIYNHATFSPSQENEFSFDEVPLSAEMDAPDAGLVHQDDLQEVLKQVDKLDKREARVIKLRFGLDGQDPLTLVEIGKTLDLTRERVRQIERDALRKLRDLVDGEAA